MTVVPRQIPCVIMRGGTSRGIIIQREHLPSAGDEALDTIAKIFGSPHPQQVDGLGGGNVVTSKLAIVGPPTRADADIDFHFVQVGIDTAEADSTGTCGNLSSAIGPYAVDEGYVTPLEPMTTVVIHDTNSGRLIRAEVEVDGGRAATTGTSTVAGIGGSGAAVVLDYSDMAGSTTGQLLPTGRERDHLTVDGSTYTVTLVDVGNPVVCLPATELGLTGGEAPADLEPHRDVLERIRLAGRSSMGLPTGDSRLPFVAIIGAARGYVTSRNERVAQNDVDVLVRLYAVGRIHPAIAATTAVNVTAAASLEGSVVADVCGSGDGNTRLLRLGHPGGVMPVEVARGEDGSLSRLAYTRTARRILDGIVYLPVPPP